MFVGHIDRFPAQSYLAPKLLAAMKIAFSRIQDLPADFSSSVEIDGKDFFFNIQQETCTLAEHKLAEIHHNYVDVHLVLDGQEQIGVSSQPLEITDDSKKEFDLYFGPLQDEDFITLKQGDFAIFFPHEIHKPLSTYGEPTRVKKAIIKIAIDIL
ncbi:YhcH/YjgK/YiaL family protein [Photobacterium damselae]|uniref:YhcH/YjgK/YiaL family protein n=1 Tax=Photobacterium damselae TaxID=38293 RepID=UPI001EDCECB9|nr:YhcH/YjgK/YiaL family protein [Photobacterium damselae]MCG3815793.1 YhcH/YjgK/YiaL family protein [Photobacterium damselae]